ncbi:Protein kinase-like domain [Penicillium roqueforti FM164]|uniref:non-specific serine/threonine protein kinase n=1 Tax=Penicillium roqueforti (strain FM164) TaxID=1365484 RepID=W6QBU0_PENRF|nr:Protein kinase-like domain [Penicillium roqueforti FM164]
MDVSGEERPELSLRKIIRVAQDRLLKYGPSQDIELEAENMRYISENTAIPIPHVHETQIHDGGAKSILMDYIEGQTLQDAWSSMIPSQKMSVAQELRGYVQQLRGLKREPLEPFSHKHIYMRRPVYLDEYLFSRLRTSVPDLLLNCTGNKWPEDKLVFTHGDLAPRNILVDDHGHVTAVLDWELSGWQPEWCETVRAYTFCNDIPGWTAYLSAVFPPGDATEYMAVAFARHMK